jgi:hypothetical protein
MVFAVEIATRNPNFLDLEGNLLRVGGLARELRESGKSIPRDQLHRWHFSYEDFEKAMRCYLSENEVI